MKLTPFGSNVILRRLPASTRFGGFKNEFAAEVRNGVTIPGAGFVEGLLIALPSEVLAHDSFECEVLHVGPGEMTLSGNREPMNVSPGDHVLVFQGAGTELEESDHFVVDISALEAVIEK